MRPCLLRALWVVSVLAIQAAGVAAEETQGWAALQQETETLGKPEWRPMLRYTAELHERATHPPTWPISLPWEEIGPGYTLGRAFGHWDIVHQIMDTLPVYPQHALNQLLNDIENQDPAGFIPGSIWLPDPSQDRLEAEWNKESQTHPPVWVAGVQDYLDQTGNLEVLPQFYKALLRQIDWFEKNRKARTSGFYYNDILLRKWESGIDCGIRFDDAPADKLACIDATSHVYWLYKHAARWAQALGNEASAFEQRALKLREFIQTELYCEEDGMFYDIWAIEDPSLRHVCVESIWPVVTGAASDAQAQRYIDEYLLNPDAFFTVHPIASVGRTDPKFELRIWRGGAWNSMTYWALRGCLDYGHPTAARQLAEQALDDTARQFDRTGTIWEFYHPDGGRPEDVLRKGDGPDSKPCPDYLGHNPVIEMARIYDRVSVPEQE